MGCLSCKHRHTSFVETCSSYSSEEEGEHVVTRHICDTCGASLLLDTITDSGFSELIQEERCPHPCFEVDKRSVTAKPCSSGLGSLLNMAQPGFVKEYKLVADALCVRCFCDLPVYATDIDETQIDEYGTPYITWSICTSALPKKRKRRKRGTYDSLRIVS